MHQISMNLGSRITDPSSSCLTAIPDNVIWSAAQWQLRYCNVICKMGQNGYCDCYCGDYIDLL